MAQEQTWFWKGSPNLQVWPDEVFKYPSDLILNTDEASRVVCRNTPELLGFECRYRQAEQDMMFTLEKQNGSPH